MNGVEGFSDRLVRQIQEKKSVVVAGLDPEYLRIPLCFRRPAIGMYGNSLKSAAESIIAFNEALIDIVAPLVPVVKPQVAFYEMYGLEGMRAFVRTVNYAKSKGLLVIEDAKRNDIGSTAEAYSRGHLGCAKLDDNLQVPVFDVDAITVNAYLGSDGIKPFLLDIESYKKGIFVLVKTSNPSSSEVQDLVIGGTNSKLYEFMAERVSDWGDESIGKFGYSSVGAVVGATFPQDAKILRNIMPRAFFLVPGYGAQGGTAKDVSPCFNSDGLGAIISASRSINYPHGTNIDIDESEFKGMVKAVVNKMNNDLNNMLLSRKSNI